MEDALLIQAPVRKWSRVSTDYSPSDGGCATERNLCTQGVGSSAGRTSIHAEAGDELAVRADLCTDRARAGAASRAPERR